MTLETLKKFKIGQDRPLITLEINPPRGADITPILARLQGRLEGVDFLNVTDSALAKMKLSGITFGALLKKHFNKEVMVNFACRDRNIIAMQSDLLGAWASGVHSIIALTGDALTVGDYPEGRGVFEVNSLGLLKIIQTLNSGHDMANQELKGNTDFTAGVVVNPNARNTNAEIKRLHKKKEAGALYALSQPVFDIESSTSFFEAASKVGIPLFIGLLAFKKAEAALSVEQYIPGIKLSEEIRQLMTERPNDDMSEFFLEHCLKIAAANRQWVCGFHVISGALPKLALTLTERLVKYVNSLG